MIALAVKNVGLNGQISLGKKFAGKQVSVIDNEDGTLLIKTGKFIPDNESWLYKNNGEARLEKALDWYRNSKRKTDNCDEILSKIENA